MIACRDKLLYKYPDYMNLNIENKYGDVYMENNTGEFKISISNGSLKQIHLAKDPL